MSNQFKFIIIIIKIKKILAMTNFRGIVTDLFWSTTAARTNGLIIIPKKSTIHLLQIECSFEVRHVVLWTC